MEKIAGQIKILVDLMRYSVFGKPLTPFEITPDWREIYRLARKNMVIASVSDGVQASDCGEEVKKAFSSQAARVLKRQILFDAARDEIFSRFDARGIKYMQLKGKYFASLYPKYGMREFSDNDILVADFERKKIDAVFSELGYRVEMRHGVHDVYQKDPIYNFEIHKSLFAERYAALNDYFSDIWERVVKVGESSNEYRMSGEDLYLYVLSHMYKHSLAGTGLRSFADFYLLKNALTGLDFDTVENGLEKLGLVGFERDVKRICEGLFGGEACTLSEAELLELGSLGAYGSTEERTRKEIEKYGKKFLWRKIFPPLKLVRENSAAVDKCPILYPFYIVGRAFKILFTPKRRKNAVNKLKMYKESKREVDED